ncbi:hypothetical protein XI03_07150 [Bradyrhizobium sp. CCBAU 65884]|uniref:hypothetical protein n=1 Tax=Bradyrhizobium sp. CCBAU 65884 TaxID=722477 RepID=UPI0023051A18|nr:hypothetical protein [Bradyrhizobium sp. CCBAU 65884]MDA9474289.1 hypothetical protein [Bradyrhizobium sp. CCBAU 65884]
MSQIHKVFLSAVAVAATLGAVQLASGHDLADRWQAVADKADKPGHNVNRTGKADRLAEIKQAAVPTRTVSMRLNDLAGTSVLLRVPAVIETGNAKPPALLQNQKKVRNRPTIACEPMVSSLTEVAKLLQPGRCVT